MKRQHNTYKAPARQGQNAPRPRHMSFPKKGLNPVESNALSGSGFSEKVQNAEELLPCAILLVAFLPPSFFPALKSIITLDQVLGVRSYLACPCFMHQML